MLAAERQAKIIEMIKSKGSVQVEDLAQELKVSAMTIRRDLVKLQEEGKVERCHGGAVAKQEVNYAKKQTSHRNVKERLAGKCASFVSEGDTIFLDAGTTTYEIAKRIKEIPGILIVTNDLEIARLFMDSEVEVFVCGGRVQKATGSMFDRYAAGLLADFKFDIGFFGAASINEAYEVTTPTVEKMWIKRETPKQCEKAYLVVDHSKFDRQAMVRVNHLKDYTAVVTDYKFCKEELEELRKMGTVIIRGQN